MERYLLTLFVTCEEENAIRELYSNRSWLFYKYEPKGLIPEYESTCKTQTHSEAPSLTSDVKNAGDAVLLEPTLIQKDNSTKDLCNTRRCTEDLFDKDESLKKDGIGNFSGAASLETSGSNVSVQDTHGNVLYSDISSDDASNKSFEKSDNMLNECNKLSKSSDKTTVDDGLGPERVHCKFQFEEHISQHVKKFINDKDYGENEKTEQEYITRMSSRIKIKKTKECGKSLFNGQNNVREGISKKSKLTSKKITKTATNGKTLDKGNSNQNPKQGRFHCSECNVTFKLLGPYNNHKRNGRCVFTCEYCGKVYTSRYYYNYQIHLKYHRKERAHQCDICGKSYIEANALKIHKRKHSNEKPFICDLCGLRFFSSSHLIYHKKSMHSETHEIHQCDICGAILSTTGNLRVHKQTVHLQERSFVCQKCGKAFKTKKALEQKHAKVHEDVFPYKCDFSGCEKSFKNPASLSVHLRRHNNQRSHFCERCGKGFYNKKDLGLHTRTHTGEKPYSCHLCEYSCTLAGNLRKHLKIHNQDS